MQTLPDVNTFEKKKDEKYLFSNLEVSYTDGTQWNCKIYENTSLSLLLNSN